MNRIILNETSYFGYNSRSVLKEEIIKSKFMLQHKKLTFGTK